MATQTAAESGRGHRAVRSLVRTGAERTRSVRTRARQVVRGSSGARRYLRPGTTLEQFFETLRRQDVPYVVLRWFDSLPQVGPGEDIDILVADEHLDQVHSLLATRPLSRNSQKFDVYTVSGLPGSDFGGIPYYPPRFARAILDSAVWLHGRYRVPDPEHHLHSLAYHAVYHKGYASGLPREEGAQGDQGPSDHDYAGVLRELAADLGSPLEPTLDAVDRRLHERGLRPPLDALERLLPRNPWIRDRFFTDLPAVEPVWQGLAVFVLRERAEELVAVAADELERNGFEVLEVIDLDPARREAASDRLRGGNWERGPWPLSGGRPSTYIVGYDVAPRFAESPQGGLVNTRIPVAKARVRERLLDGVAAAQRYNPLHSSDNPLQALDYLDVLESPRIGARLRAAAAELVDACAMPFDVVRHLAPQAPARRARVALVDHPIHGHSVCKVYRPGALRFFERELRARKELADLPEVPGLLEHGHNWLLTPLYGDDRRHVLRGLSFRDMVQLRPEAARALARFAASLHERGLFLLDLSTQNLMSDPVAGLKVLDLEFLQEYSGAVPALADCYTFRGIPAGLRGLHDAPRDVALTADVGNSVFHPAVTGLPVADLLAPPRAVTAVRGAAVRLAWFAWFAATSPYRRARSSLAASRYGSRLKAVRRRMTTRQSGRT